MLYSVDTCYDQPITSLRTTYYWTKAMPGHLIRMCSFAPIGIVNCEIGFRLGMLLWQIGLERAGFQWKHLEYATPFKMQLLTAPGQAGKTTCLTLFQLNSIQV